MSESKFLRWDVKIHHPSERCEGTSQATGSCPFCKVPSSNYCMRHGGASVATTKKKEDRRNYDLGKWQARVGQLADNDSIRSLREEVGILRIVMETMLNQCKDATELMLYSSRISDLVMKIEKLVTSTDKLEGKMGLLISKDSVLQLAAVYVGIIADHVEDPETMDEISMKMMQATMDIQNPVPNAPGTGGGGRDYVSIT